jgi:hypothetical protein
MQVEYLYASTNRRAELNGRAYSRSDCAAGRTCVETTEPQQKLGLRSLRPSDGDS